MVLRSDCAREVSAAADKGGVGRALQARAQGAVSRGEGGWYGGIRYAAARFSCRYLSCPVDRVVARHWVAEVCGYSWITLDCERERLLNRSTHETQPSALGGLGFGVPRLFLHRAVEWYIRVHLYLHVSVRRDRQFVSPSLVVM